MDNELKTEPATMSGEAAVIRAKPAVLRATIHITRAATGKVETYELTGTPVEPPKEPT